MNPKRLSENSRDPKAPVNSARAGRPHAWRPWTDEERQYVIANHLSMDTHALGKEINRSHTAVELWLVENNLTPLKVVSMLKRGRRPSPGFVRTDDEAHLAAIFQARPRGFAW